MIGDSNISGYVVGGAGVLLAIGQMAWSKFFSSEGKANDVLIGQLSERIAAQESRLSLLEAGLDTEREARRKAEDKVHLLELDNVLLRAELRRHGIDVNTQIPPDYALRQAEAAKAGL